MRRTSAATSTWPGKREAKKRSMVKSKGLSCVAHAVASQSGHASTHRWDVVAGRPLAATLAGKCICQDSLTIHIR